MRSFFGLVKEDKINELQRYKIKKCGGKIEFDIKNFYTPLDIGKYKLAVLIEELLKKTNYRELVIDLYIIYKINEFLEQPEIYSLLSPPLTTELSNRKDFSGLNEASSALGLERFVNKEINRLFELFMKRFKTVSVPDELPGYLRTGSIYGKYSTIMYGTSSLHAIIKSHYDQCQQRILAEEKPALQEKNLAKM